MEVRRLVFLRQTCLHLGGLHASRTARVRCLEGAPSAQTQVERGADSLEGTDPAGGGGTPKRKIRS